MATKKQKREAAEAKRKAYEAQLKEDGLRAQKADQERREAQAAAMKEQTDKANQRYMDILAKPVSPAELAKAQRFVNALMIGGRQ